MTKDEYVKTLEKYVAEKVVDDNQDYYYNGYFDGLKCAADLAEKLDESQKAVIPEFVADWITKTKANFTDEPLYTAEVIANAIDEGTDYHFDWLEDVENQKLLLNAIANGYEVEKEPELHVKLKGLVIGSAYLNYNIPFKTFSTNSLSSPKHMSTEFTKSWLAKNWPEYEAYNNAGLLEFEEVEDES